MALKEVSLAVKPGEFLCLMGPSGCGKSTLLRIMANLEPATSGVILNRPKQIGFVFQNFALLPWLTVSENIGFGLKMAGVGKSLRRKTVSHLVQDLELKGLERKHPKELSGGQKQRVGLARALAVDPDVLMLDEPFSALDAFTAAELRLDLLKIWQATGKTVVMVTHLPSEAAQLADRILVFSPQPGTVIKEIKNDLPRPRHERSKPFFDIVDELESLIKQPV